MTAGGHIGFGTGNWERTDRDHAKETGREQRGNRVGHGMATAKGNGLEGDEERREIETEGWQIKN